MLTLLELNRQIQGVVTRAFSDTYLVTAEVASVRAYPASRCVFINLVERQDGQVVAKMGGIAFLGTYERIQREFTDVVGEPFKGGMRVLLAARVQFQPEYGLQLNIENIDPSYTLGDAERRKREVVERLRREELIDLNKARSFPLVPQYVAIISSRAAAGYEDFVNQLERNPYGFRLVCKLFDTRVQGNAAQASLVSAFHRVRQRAGMFDAVVLIRGGGSPTDLDCFNEYGVTSEIARCPLPVITGIGHERDETLADMVACRSVKTPTAAAELLLGTLRGYEDRVNVACRELEGGVSRALSVSEVALEQIAARLSITVKERLRQEQEALGFRSRSRSAFGKSRRRSETWPGNLEAPRMCAWASGRKSWSRSPCSAATFPGSDYRCGNMDWPCCSRSWNAALPAWWNESVTG